MKFRSLQITISDTYIVYEKNTIEVLSNQASIAVAEKLAETKPQSQIIRLPSKFQIQNIFLRNGFYLQTEKTILSFVIFKVRAYTVIT